MKKFASILLAVLLILSLCACGGEAAPEEDVKIDAQPKVEATTAVQTATEPKETETPETAAPSENAEELSDKALAESCIDKSVQELYDLIGEPASSDYAPSCLVDGEDGMLYYDGFVVYTTREGDVETVYYVE